MLQYRSHGLTVAELWFDETADGIKPDILRHTQSLVPLTRGTCSDFCTLVVDLARSEDDLLAQMTKENRYEIRRATEKDALTLWVWDGTSDDAVPRFVAYYNEFAAGKGLPDLSLQQVVNFQRAGCLDLSRVDDSEGNTLVYHAYYLGASRVRLLFSASLFRASGDNAFRSLVGRANRWLHWQDMRRFKAQQKSVYDFGGWYDGSEDEAKLRINTFKESFGGQVQRTYNGEEFVTLRAKAARSIRSLLTKLRRGKH